MALHEIPSLQFTPESDIKLLSGVPLTKDYQHTRQFPSSVTQQDYFLTKAVRSIGDGTYVKKDDVIRFNVNAEKLYDVNYLMFRNKNYGNKWFYAFVTNIEYRNPETTFIHFEIDVLQTWWFSINFRQSYIEREHTTLRENGLPVINTIDEGLNYGNDYDTVKRLKVEQVPDMVFGIITAKAKLEANKSGNSYYTGTNYGAPSTLNYYIVPIPLGSISSDGYTPFIYWESGGGDRLSSIEELYSQIADDPDLQSMIVSISFTPFLPIDIRSVVSSDKGYDIISPDLTMASFGKIKILKPRPYAKSKTKNITVSSNKYNGLPNYFETKLLMYPYSLLELTDEKGEKIEIPLESIQGTDPKQIRLNIKSSISNLPKYAVFIENYNNLTTGEPEMEKALVSKDIQDVPIISDYTATYLQGNRNSYNQGIINTAIGTSTNLASSAMMANPYMAVSTLSSGLTSILSTQAKMKDINNRPPTISNLGKNANFDISNGNNGVWLTWKTIKPEYQKKLNSYFKLFGYKVNEVKYPNLHTRKSWNYVKTIECNIIGNIIQTDLDKIKNIFDNGVTIWHTNDVANYSLDNTEL